MKAFKGVATECHDQIEFTVRLSVWSVCTTTIERIGGLTSNFTLDRIDNTNATNLIVRVTKSIVNASPSVLSKECPASAGCSAVLAKQEAIQLHGQDKMIKEVTHLDTALYLLQPT